MELDTASEYQKLNIQELQEIRHDTYENAQIYKEKTKAFHEQKISRKTFFSWLENVTLRPYIKDFCR